MLTISGAEAGACFVDYINNSWKFIVWVYGSSSQGISFSEIYNLSRHPAITNMITKSGYILVKSKPILTKEFFNLHYKENPDNDGVMNIFHSAILLMKEDQLVTDFE